MFKKYFMLILNFQKNKKKTIIFTKKFYHLLNQI